MRSDAENIGREAQEWKREGLTLNSLMQVTDEHGSDRSMSAEGQRQVQEP